MERSHIHMCRGKELWACNALWCEGRYKLDCSEHGETLLVGIEVLYNGLERKPTAS